MSRVAISGYGLVSAAGAGVSALTAAVREGRTHLGDVGDALSAGLPIRFGGRVPEGALGGDGDRVLRLAGPALTEALERGALDGPQRATTGLTLGSGLGSMERTEALLAGSDVPLLDLQPHAITRALAAGQALGGPLGTHTVTCASALFALEQACAALAMGRASAMVCGGLETLSRTILAGFCALDALSASAGPEAPSPTDGIVLGEGACFVLLEALEAARARGVAPRALVAGRGLRGDGVHMTTPDAEGHGMEAAVRACLDEAGVAARDVGRISLTAPSSPGYAAMYDNALGRVFGQGWRSRSATWEGAVGHLLGASGVLGLVFADLLIGGDLGEGTDSVLALTVGFGGINGATLVVRA